MLKNLLMLLLCVPLVYVGVTEGLRLYGPSQAATAAAPADLSDADAVLQTAHKKGSELGRLHPELRAAVLRLDDELHAGTSAGEPFTALTDTLMARANDYRDVRLFLRQYGGLGSVSTGDLPVFRGSEKGAFGRLVENRRGLLEMEREMKRLAVNLPGDADKLRSLAREYKVKDSANGALANDYLARCDRSNLEARGNQLEKDFTPALSGGELRRLMLVGIDDYLRDVKAFSDNPLYLAVNESDRWAAEQSARWSDKKKQLERTNYANMTGKDLVDELVRLESADCDIGEDVLRKAFRPISDPPTGARYPERELKDCRASAEKVEKALRSYLASRPGTPIAMSRERRREEMRKLLDKNISDTGTSQLMWAVLCQTVPLKVFTTRAEGDSARAETQFNPERDGHRDDVVKLKKSLNPERN
jgi:hypothetical protein